MTISEKIKQLYKDILGITLVSLPDENHDYYKNYLDKEFTEGSFVKKGRMLEVYCKVSDKPLVYLKLYRDSNSEGLEFTKSGRLPDSSTIEKIV